MRYRLAHSREIKKNRWNKICPICKQPKFSPYIDTVTNQPIAAKECGRCCREKSCAYHMTPKEWFKDNPTEKREWLPKEQYVELMRQRRREAEQAKEAPLLSPQRGMVQSSRYEVEEYCKRMSTLCHKSRSDKNNLARWLSTQFPAEQVAEVLARYRTGSTRDGRIIYWQIDEQGQVRAGKVMAYDLDGHRVKRKETHPNPPYEGGNSTSRCQHPLPCRADAKGASVLERVERFALTTTADLSAPRSLACELWGGSPPVCWVHSMRIDGIKFDEMLLPQCLFGLSLLNTEHTASTTDCTDFSDDKTDGSSTPQEKNLCSPRNPCHPWSETIGVVESEKTALILSLIKPDTVWLATGGKANLKESMLAPLIGVEVAVYPDADALHDWYTRAVEMNRTLGTRLHIPTWYYNLMDHDEAIAQGVDLADILMGVGEYL